MVVEVTAPSAPPLEAPLAVILPSWGIQAEALGLSRPLWVRQRGHTPAVALGHAALSVEGGCALPSETLVMRQPHPPELDSGVSR